MLAEVPVCVYLSTFVDREWIKSMTDVKSHAPSWTWKDIRYFREPVHADKHVRSGIFPSVESRITVDCIKQL